MSGSVEGGRKTAETNKAREPDFYKRIGKLGGSKSRTGGFFANRELARTAGRLGGLKSKRPKANG